MLAFVRSPPGGLPERELVIDWAVARLIAESRHAQARDLLLDAPALPSSLSELRDQRRQTVRALDLVLQGGRDLDLGYDLDAPILASKAAAAPADMSMDVDLTQPAWASPAPKALAGTPPRSVLEARQQADQRAKASRPPSLSARDLPTSASPGQLPRVPSSGLPPLSSSASPFRKPASFLQQALNSPVGSPRGSLRMSSVQPRWKAG